MSILSRLRNLERLREPGLPVIEPLQTPLPRQIGGLSPQIGGIAPILPTILPVLPTQSITLPGGQTVQIPQINMDEVNANLAAAGITPQAPPTFQPTTDTSELDLPVSLQPESITELAESQAKFAQPRDFQIPNPLDSLPRGTPRVLPPAEMSSQPIGDRMSVERLPSLEMPSSPLDAIDDLGVPIFGGRDIPGAASPKLDRQITVDPSDININISEGLGLMPFPSPNTMSDPNVSIPTKTPQTTSVPATTSPSPGAEVSPAPVAPPAPREDMPFVPSVRQVATGLDPLTEQLLFGIGGEGGFIPGAMRAAEKTFFDEEGKPVVIEEQVAGFSPDQIRAQELARQGVGIQDRFISGAEGAFGQGIDALRSGFGRARGLAGEGLEATRAGVGQLQRGLGESADILRGTIGGYDQAMTDRFYNPFEDRVVQQTIDDIMEAGAKQDIAARAGDIGRGGESAFGSRARLGASERQEALGRGLAEALGGIRARGFSEAQQTGLGEFARQRAAERAAASGLAGLTGQGFTGQQALAGALTGLGGIEQQLAQQQQAAQFGLGSALQGLGAQAQGASAADVAQLYGMGTQQQALTQAQLDAQRRNQLQAQQAPLAQFQALAPFVSMAPAGQFQTVTDFAPPPSPMQVGIGTGLSTLGALGNLYGGG
jgi:hypothetical protein